jgi:hypothetical protein
MKGTLSSDMSVDFQRITLRHIPEDRSPHNHRCEDLNSYKTQQLSEKYSCGP